MKFLVIISFALVAAASAQGTKYYQGSPVGEANARILYQTRELNPGQSYSYSYGTDNGIAADEKGVFNYPAGPDTAILNVEGGYQYTAPTGEVVSVKYVAGPQGYAPQTKISYPGNAGYKPINVKGPIYPIDRRIKV